MVLLAVVGDALVLFGWGWWVQGKSERVAQLREFKGIGIQFTLFIMSCLVIGPNI